MTAYYNELDEYAAQWLRNLIAAGHIADGVVDNRSISEVQPSDLREFTQCHFFAGIGVWSHALRLAGWPDERRVWTGSCPCQPFSVAGRADGFDDERHLWPHWHHLIRECRPETVFGEQVASKDGLAWLDLVQSDMEGEGYAFAANDLCAAGVGAPHIRQRLYFVADSTHPQHNGAGCRRSSGRVEHTDSGAVGILGDDDDAGLEGQRSGHKVESGRHRAVRSVAEAGELGGVGNSFGSGRQPQPQDIREHGDGVEPEGREQVSSIKTSSNACRMADATGESGGLGNAKLHGPHHIVESGKPQEKRWLLEPEGPGAVQQTGPTNGHWRDADWLFCRDGKWRPVEPGLKPLVNGASSRVGRLRAYGNAIVPQVAQAFIEAFLEVRP